MRPQPSTTGEHATLCVHASSTERRSLWHSRQGYHLKKANDATAEANTLTSAKRRASITSKQYRAKAASHRRAAKNDDGSARNHNERAKKLRSYRDKHRAAAKANFERATTHRNHRDAHKARAKHHKVQAVLSPRQFLSATADESRQVV